MRTHSLLSFVSLAIVLAAACPPASARADDTLPPKQGVMLASGMSDIPHDGFGIVTVSAPRALPAGATSVTLWDEITPPMPLPAPVPIPQPSDVQHAMQGNTENGMRQ
ncbi:hypothetical protein NUV25_26280 [Burkholderia pseudomultivorans]|uniref:hypothetical protein n=1 Tax=Burkholderia pseudomultivorans TaxID=1207504 RepID=UPI002876B325|nr:hypothetical protein [Burkholderia pseudomultivorans]MDS0861224.1 hypothetical protein [Burkholderia pseudomultivorans]